MIDLGPPPQLILPAHFEGNRPAIIRPELDLARYFPVQISRGERRAILAELRRAGRVDANLPGMVPVVVAGSGSTPASVVFTGDDSNSSSLTTYSFATHPFGSAATGRAIVVGITTGGTTNAVVSSCTIGGVAASLYGNLSAGGVDNASSCIAIATVPTGVSGEVSITCAGSRARCAIGVWAVYGLASITPVASGSSSAGPGSVSLATTNAGVIVAIAYIRVSSTITWSNVTEDFETTYSSTRVHSGASALTTGSTVGVQATYSGSSSKAMSAVSLF